MISLISHNNFSVGAYHYSHGMVRLSAEKIRRFPTFSKDLVAEKKSTAIFLTLTSLKFLLQLRMFKPKSGLKLLFSPSILKRAIVARSSGKPELQG